MKKKTLKKLRNLAEDNPHFAIDQNHKNQIVVRGKGNFRKAKKLYKQMNKVQKAIFNNTDLTKFGVNI